MNDKLKQHWQENKKLYIVGATSATIGALGAAAVIFKLSPKIANVQAIQALTYKSTQTVEVWIEALGDPGNIIQDMTTGTIYASQGQAAKALGVSPSYVSQHLNGIRDHVKGHQLKVLGKAMVSQE